MLLVGLGELGARVLELLVRAPGAPAIVVGGRDPEALRPRVNLAVLAAMQLGHAPDVTIVRLDLDDVDATAETLARLRPAIAIHAATQLAPRLLPAGPLGWWLPLQVVLAHRLMQAVARSGHAIRVVNAVYPDVVNPLLGGVGLAPWIGSGNLANNVPALRRALADQLACRAEAVELRMVMHHAVSHRVHRLGTAGEMPYHLSARVAGEPARIDPEAAFRALAGAWRRPGGAQGQRMAAASTVALVEAMLSGTRTVLHAPAPAGLPGGYPVALDGERVELCLPDGLTAAHALAINEAAQRFDGIEHVAHGTVRFTDSAAEGLRALLGYDGRELSLADAPERAAELRSRLGGLQPNVRSSAPPSAT